MADPQFMLAANRLIHEYGEGAEEYAASQLWKARSGENADEAAKWQNIVDALKKVRDLRKKV